MTPADLAHALPTLLPKKGTPATEALERAEDSRALELPLEELQRLRLRQQQNAQIFQRQKSRVHFPSPPFPCLLDPSHASLTASARAVYRCSP